MPGGKPAGVKCVQLDEDERCRIFGHPDRPSVCSSLQPQPAMCGDSRVAAMLWLTTLEQATLPTQIVGQEVPLALVKWKHLRH